MGFALYSAIGLTVRMDSENSQRQVSCGASRKAELVRIEQARFQQKGANHGFDLVDRFNPAARWRTAGLAIQPKLGLRPERHLGCVATSSAHHAVAQRFALGIWTRSRSLSVVQYR